MSNIYEGGSLMGSQATKVKTVKLTPAERAKLERLCRGGNWSDGGHWIGIGKEPNCFIKEVATNTRIHTITFPTDQAAFKWNKEWEDAIRHAGHFATAVITVTVALSTSGTGGIVAGTLAGIFKDEVQARIKYPKVGRGWKYVLKVTRTSKYTPHPWNNNGLTIEMVGETYDISGKLQYSSKAIAHYDFDELPKAIADKLAQMPSTKTTSVYR
jgi:hypothetical protein